MRPPPIYLIPSPKKKLVTPTPFVMPSIIRLSKKFVNSANPLIPFVKDVE